LAYRFRKFLLETVVAVMHVETAASQTSDLNVNVSLTKMKTTYPDLSIGLGIGVSLACVLSVRGVIERLELDLLSDTCRRR
jgi:hypothetical protein